MKIGILGTGSVASHLAEGLQRAGHDVRLGSRTPKPKGNKKPAAHVVGLKDAVGFGDVVVWATPWHAVDAVLSGIGAGGFKGKTVIDAMNVLSPTYELAVGHTTSGAEELQKKLPGAFVIKAFNTVFADNMATGKVGTKVLSVFVAGDHAAAKQTVLDLARAIGFDVVDAGPLRNARYLEPMAMQVIALGFGPAKMGTGIGLVLAR